MKKNSTSQSAFFNPRVLLASVFCLAGVFTALISFGTFSDASAQADANNSSSAQGVRPNDRDTRNAQRSVTTVARAAIGLAANGAGT
jgi:hypothetical protein